MPVHPNFHGIKGRSGRKPYNEERDIEEIIRLSNKTILHYLNSPLYSDEKKTQLAVEFSKRRVSDKKQIDATILNKEEQSIIDKYVNFNRLPTVIPAGSSTVEPKTESNNSN